MLYEFFSQREKLELEIIAASGNTQMEVIPLCRYYSFWSELEPERKIRAQPFKHS